MTQRTGGGSLMCSGRIEGAGRASTGAVPRRETETAGDGAEAERRGGGAAGPEGREGEPGACECRMAPF